ncbi:hypothetical protein [Halarcobacter anaerophilus]|jgi:flagellar biosynthesis chaperone FliJ|uniref:Uncharacterized protein n=1 Tax=Halarcobacter anaerophilus TaxID=877500 RepID=A0A4Q0XZR1_9BACT|nr:hypothetical protein [Halarcobacter anaerophilus]QDF29850.1 hypothetical protein AANAER_2393 [Halarcobacter anaerophilus]RXJ62813.1 hypothetical protein CRV06_08235 [Halarcobacter anaerophilus]
MVEKIVNDMIELVVKMQNYINLDIEDIKKARHEALLDRNDEKQIMIEQIAQYKQELNQEIVKEMQRGVDVNIYRDYVDNLENELKNLYKLNRKLAQIVEPIQKMYKDIVEDISDNNGGTVFNVTA